ncbi:MAG: hypothetical protein ACI4CS_04530, partial [Candidatus Weimeria sp.]
MSSVTQRIKKITQPRGGYINPRSMKEEQLGEGIDALNPKENIPPYITGTVVDYMTRFMETKDAEDAFKISLIGLRGAGIFGVPVRQGDDLIDNIKGLDDNSIISAAKLTAYDSIYRAGVYTDPDTINPDSDTIENIRTMINRAMHFFDVYGPKVLDGFTFEGGYTDIVNTGDGDFTTSDTLWDFKVSKYPPTSAHTLQILM